MAVRLANEINGEIISVDSRQIYRGMDIGSGKDLNEYKTDGKKIKYHLIDIRNAGEKYNLYEFKKDCEKAIERIEREGRRPVLCGGTGLYFDSILFDYHLPEASVDENFRKELLLKSNEELINMLKKMSDLHNTTDTLDRERTIRAIEVARAEESGKEIQSDVLPSIVFGLRGNRDLVRKKIEIRLKERLESGLIEEVEELMNTGNVSAEELKYYGLEYKFVCMYIMGELNQNDMYQKLRSGINQFSKRQMTWFRRMEKKGVHINWLDIESGPEKNLTLMLDMLEKDNS